MPTDWPRIQSTSKVKIVSTADLALLISPLHQHQIVSGIGPGHTGLKGEAVEQLQDHLRGCVPQRYDAYAITAVGAVVLTDASTGALSIAARNEAKAARAVFDQHHVAHPQRIFEDYNKVTLRYRSPRRDGDRSLDPGIDRVADVKNVPEDHFSDGGNRCILEI